MPDRGTNHHHYKTKGSKHGHIGTDPGQPRKNQPQPSKNLSDTDYNMDGVVQFVHPSHEIRKTFGNH